MTDIRRSLIEEDPIVAEPTLPASAVREMRRHILTAEREVSRPLDAHLDACLGAGRDHCRWRDDQRRPGTLSPSAARVRARHRRRMRR